MSNSFKLAYHPSKQSKWKITSILVITLAGFLELSTLLIPVTFKWLQVIKP